MENKHGLGKIAAGNLCSGLQGRGKALSGRAASHGSEPGFSTRSRALSASAGRNTAPSTLGNHNGWTPVPTASSTLTAL